MIATLIWFFLVIVCLACIPAIFIELRKINKRLDGFDFETEEPVKYFCSLSEDIYCTSRIGGTCNYNNECSWQKETIHE